MIGRVLLFSFAFYNAAVSQDVNTNPTSVTDATETDKRPAESQVKVDSATGPSAIESDQEITLENSVALRDPFRRPSTKMSQALAEAATVPDLERHDVDQLKLVGIITGAKKNKALVSTPDGKMHVVTESTRLGTRRGYVKKITASELLVEEKILNLLGQEEKIEASIRFIEKEKK